MIITTINGIVGNNPEIRSLNSSTQIISFTVAAGKKKNAQNEYETIWVKCVKFYNSENQIYNLNNIVKGCKISVSGKSEIESYISKTNEFKAILKLHVDHFEIIEKNLDQNNTAVNTNLNNNTNKLDQESDFPF